MLWKSLARLLGNTEPVNGRTFAWMALVGLLAGGVKATMHRNPQTKPIDIIVAAVGSGLSSFLTGSALLYFWGSERLLMIITVCGVAGWIGVALLDVASDYAWRFVEAKWPAARGDDQAGRPKD